MVGTRPYGRRTIRSLLVVAASLVAAMPAVASAAPPPVPELAGARTSAVLAPGDRVHRSSARSRDVTGDGWPDIVARQPGSGNGALYVYTHSQKVQGMTTFSTKTLVGTGWNVHSWVGVAELTGDTPEYETTPEAPADLLARRASDGAMMVYPHSGTFNGTSTWVTPAVVVLTGMNTMHEMVLADVNTDGFDDLLAWDNTDKLWLYQHSGTFNGTQTFLPPVHLFTGRPLWLLATEWARENPDLITVSLATGEIGAARHTNKFTPGTDPWDRRNHWQVSTNVFTHPTTTYISLIDLNGDGKDDFLKILPSGALMYYPFRGWGQSPALGAPVQIGQGWQVMDLIT